MAIYSSTDQAQGRKRARTSRGSISSKKRPFFPGLISPKRLAGATITNPKTFSEPMQEESIESARADLGARVALQPSKKLVMSSATPNTPEDTQLAEKITLPIHGGGKDDELQRRNGDGGEEEGVDRDEAGDEGMEDNEDIKVARKTKAKKRGLAYKEAPSDTKLQHPSITSKLEKYLQNDKVKKSGDEDSGDEDSGDEDSGDEDSGDQDSGDEDSSVEDSSDKDNNWASDNNKEKEDVDKDVEKGSEEAGEEVDSEKDPGSIGQVSANTSSASSTMASDNEFEEGKTSTFDCEPALEYYTVQWQPRPRSKRIVRHRNRVERRKNLNAAQTPTWRKLDSLDAVEYKGDNYKLNDVVLICVGGGSFEPARIREIRELSDGRKMLAVLWYFDKQETKANGAIMARWPSGATHILTNWLQVVMWDTLNGRPSKSEVRVSEDVVLEVCHSVGSIVSWDDALVRWIYEL